MRPVYAMQRQSARFLWAVLSKDAMDTMAGSFTLCYGKSKQNEKPSLHVRQRRMQRSA